MAPSAPTITAPTGTSPASRARTACSSARRMAAISASSATVGPILERDAAGQAFHGLFQPLIQLRLVVVARLVQVGNTAFLDEPPCPAALVAVAGIPDAECDSAGTADQ